MCGADIREECKNLGVFLGESPVFSSDDERGHGRNSGGRFGTGRSRGRMDEKNPATVDEWLAGVSAFDGEDGREAFRKAMGF